MSAAYYIAAQSGNVLGPYEEKEIVDLVTDGLVNVEDKCTREGEENWKPLGTVVPAVWTSRGAKLRPRRVMLTGKEKACPSCGNAMSRSAAKCPSCGHPNRGVLYVRVIVLAILAFIIWAVWQNHRLNQEFKRLKERGEEFREEADRLLGK